MDSSSIPHSSSLTSGAHVGHKTNEEFYDVPIGEGTFRVLKRYQTLKSIGNFFFVVINLKNENFKHF